MLPDKTSIGSFSSSELESCSKRCALWSPHPGHLGLEDSQWTQWKTITDYYQWCRARGIYLNVPDLYYLNGSSKCGMGDPKLDSDIIHARRPDARDIDFYLHVNPQLKEKALIMVFNPLEGPASKLLKVPLYYSGLTGKAMIGERDGKLQEYQLDRDFSVNLPVHLEPQSVTWFVVESY